MARRGVSLFATGLFRTANRTCAGASKASEEADEPLEAVIGNLLATENGPDRCDELNLKLQAVTTAGPTRNLEGPRFHCSRTLWFNLSLREWKGPGGRAKGRVSPPHLWR